MSRKITVIATTFVAAVALAGAGAGAAAAASPSAAAPAPIHFSHGATSTHVSGHVAADGDRRYTFRAKAGQTATVHLARSTSAMTWMLVGPTGPAVHDAKSKRQSDFTYTLPTTGTYTIDITSTRAATYDLALAIPAAAAAPVVPVATAIHFSRGATSAHLGGHVAAAGDRRYTFRATASQTATVHLARSTSAMTWTLVGPTCPSVHNAKSKPQSDFTYKIPQTGTYYIDITSTRSATYGLTLSIR